MPKFAPIPQSWNSLNTHMVLWHGCVNTHAQGIEANGIDLSRSRNALDFGRGFYTTTDRGQAVRWARRKHANLSPVDRKVMRPAILEFHVPLNHLAVLQSLMFVRGDIRHEAFLSFVHHCRRSTSVAPQTHLHPTHVAPRDWYDVICGPLAAVWPPDGREVIPESDQFSFHTAAGIAIIDKVIATGRPGFKITAL